MQIQVIRRAMSRFENSKIFPLQVRIPHRPRIDREQEGQIGMVRVQGPLFAEIELLISGHRRKERIQEVVALLVQHTIVPGKEFLELWEGAFYLCATPVVDHDGE